MARSELKDTQDIEVDPKQESDISRLKPWEWDVLYRLVYYGQTQIQIARELNRTAGTIRSLIETPVFQQEMQAEIIRKNEADRANRMNKLSNRATDILEEALTYGEIMLPLRDPNGKPRLNDDGTPCIHRERLSGRVIMTQVDRILEGTGNRRPLAPSASTPGTGGDVINNNFNLGQVVIQQYREEKMKMAAAETSASTPVVPEQAKDVPPAGRVVHFLPERCESSMESVEVSIPDDPCS